MILAAIRPEDASALRARLQRAVEVYRTGSGLVLPGVSLVGSARRRGEGG
jgi:hypothetical protein